MRQAIVLLMFFSGFSALNYQVAWFRILGLSMGITTTAVATVLAAFFLGMALGSLLAERLIRKGYYGLGMFALAELITGLSALLLLPALLQLDHLLAAAPLLGNSMGLRFVLAIVILIIPTACIGATYPLVSAWLARQDQELGMRLSQLYAVNTLGAVGGALSAGFVLIPAWGLDGAVYIAASINLSIAISASLLDGRISQPINKETPSLTTVATKQTHHRRYLLLIIAITGFATLAHEVIWTKYLSVLTGKTLAGLSTILAAILLGISLGSGLMAWLLRRYPANTMMLGQGLLWLALSLALTRSGLGLLPGLSTESLTNTESYNFAMQFFIIGMLLLPPGLLLGALFPLSLRLYCNDINGMHHRLGHAYAINTLFAVAGAALTALWLIPSIGSDTLLQILAIAVLLSALPLLRGITRTTKTAIRLWTPALLLSAAASIMLPGLDFESMVLSAQKWNKSIYQDRLLFLKEGQAGVISLLENPQGRVFLQHNGLIEAGIADRDTRMGTLTATFLAILPYLLHESPNSAHVIGFGGGTTAHMLSLTELDSIHVTELEPVIVDAMRSISHDSLAFLDDPRITLEFDDARFNLLTRDQTYDLIISQPSHPWLSGMGNLFTTEFYHIARSRLNQGGIFAQWVNLFSMNDEAIRSILRTFYESFPKGIVFVVWVEREMILIGTDQPLALDLDEVESFISNSNMSTTTNYHSITFPGRILNHYLFSRDSALALASDAMINTDRNLFVETRIAEHQRDDPTENPIWKTMIRNLQRYQAIERDAQTNNRDNTQN